ncbi:MAG: hypothetical protein V3U70_03745 [Thermoplasmata archaeon]
MNSPTLHRLRVLILLLDEYWKPGIEIRAKDVERRLYESRRIKIAEKTVHSALDHLVSEGYLTLSSHGREKFYSINEEISSRDLREDVVRTLGLTTWISSETVSSPQEND